ncbi:MAG: benzoate-CoA ligase family protein [SAR324 cluster bacterium]|nr:benzoate-CoA ligase family protein [SAR324 cluster bacterium]
MKNENEREAIHFELPREYNAASHFIDRHLKENRQQKTAIIDKNGSYSYQDLAEQVNRAGNALRELGVQMETRVMLGMVDTIDFVTAFWGAIKIGAVPIPVNTLLTSQDYSYMLPDSRARVLIVSDILYEKFAPVLENAPFLETVLVSGEDAKGHLHYGEKLASASSSLDPMPTTSDDVACWLYSSGSTGAPKGVMHLQSSFEYVARTYGERVLGIREDDIVYSAAKLFFAYGLGNSMTFPLHVGATTVLLDERPTPDSVLAVMKKHQTTVFFGVPTLYNAILADQNNVRSTGSEKLRRCLSAGEALPEEVAKKWKIRFESEILDGIGSTEMMHIFLSNREGDICYNSTGKAVPGYELKVVDEADRLLKPGEVGELLVRGSSAAMAYWNQRQKSINTFQGQWTRTGDKYFVNDQGYYCYSGRTDDMLKISGIWVSPFEVETALMNHEQVLEVAVIGVADENELIKPKAYITLNDPSCASDTLVEELQQFVKDRLAPYKYPRWIEFIEELPKTATGKIQRFKLRAISKESAVD